MLDSGLVTAQYAARSRIFPPAPDLPADRRRLTQIRTGDFICVYLSDLRAGPSIIESGDTTLIEEGYHLPASGIRHPASGIRHPASSIEPECQIRSSEVLLRWIVGLGVCL
jgi:hypothetical protein